MKQFIFLAALVAARLASARAVASTEQRGLEVQQQQQRQGLRHVSRHRQLPATASAAGVPLWIHPQSQGAKLGTWKPCEFDKDEHGVIVPARCEGNATNGTKPGVKCELAGNKSFAAYNCTPPSLVKCVQPDLGEHAEHYVVESDVSEKEEDKEDPLDEDEDDGEQLSEHGSVATISCGDDATPIDKKLPNTTWGEDWYPGAKSEDVWCNNGTFSGHKLTCASKKAIFMLKDLEHYLRWTTDKLKVTEGIGFKWIDATALGRKQALTDAHAAAHKMLIKAQDLEVPDEAQLEAVIETMKENSIIPRGEPPSEETCKDMESVFSQATVPGRHDSMPGFTCSYTQQRTGTGYNHMLSPSNQVRAPTFFYRDGCFCESKWSAGCPFKLHYKNTYQEFGFASADEKIASESPGAYSNALCWYWSNAAHPEWGYLNRKA